MSRRQPSETLPDIVADAKLEAEVHSKYTKHFYNSSTPTTRQRCREEKWVRDKELGRGAFGVVHLERCEDRIGTALRAVKRISKIIHGHKVDYKRELEAVMKFSHAKYRHCFVQSDGWFESPEHIFISMEYLEHGDLQKHLARPLSEQEAKLITTQILEGLGFMHGNGFIHRDLKPGNIMVVNTGPKWFVKISDFGISKRRHELSTSLHTQGQGTLGFAAPEAMGIIDADRSYTSAVDMWSLGAVVYMILTGTVPFPDLQQAFSYCTGKSRFPSGMLDRQSVTKHGQEFIKAIMVPDGRKRLSSTTAAKHPWMTQSNHRSAQLSAASCWAASCWAAGCWAAATAASCWAAATAAIRWAAVTAATCWATVTAATCRATAATAAIAAIAAIWSNSNTRTGRIQRGLR
ncbi:hypothetical protein MY11210_003507 [Beauveria gryllotalpidicola]